MSQQTHSEFNAKDLFKNTSEKLLEMRLESIGGLGANLCGKLLGQLGSQYLSLNATAFSSYGSEKRGSPVKSYIRWSDRDREIRVSSPVTHPQLIALFHSELRKTLAVTAGADENTSIVVNTALCPDEMRQELKLYGGKLLCVDALKIAGECKSRVNMVMIGAIVRALEAVPLDAAKAVVCDTLGKKYPAMLNNNLKAVERGYSEVKIKYFEPDGSFEMVKYSEPRGKWGYKNAPIGGANYNLGSSVSNELSASREGFIPLFIFEKCIHCGLCDSTCPDMVFQFTEGEFKGRKTQMNRGLDYHHCKGCLRCVDICPTEALVAARESEHPDKRWFVRNKDLICESIDFEVKGADPWITSEAYLDEKRVDGGQM